MQAERAAPVQPPAPPGATGAKFSRYRSVRRQQAAQHQATADQQIPAVPVPPIPATMDDKKPGGDSGSAPVSRSMSRYHRRPTTSHQNATPAGRGPPVRSQTEVVPPVPSPAALPQNSSNAGRYRAMSSPHQSRAASQHAQPQPRLPPNTGVPLVSKGLREPSQTARDEAKQLMEKEAERHRRMQEKLRAEKQARLEADQAERERVERERREEEERRIVEKAERERREAEEAEELRRQQEEQERGKRLQKAETAARLKKREEEARKAKIEEARRKLEEHSTRPPSPPNSPPKHGFGLFGRKRAPTSPESPSNGGRSRQTSNGNRDLDTIRPGGGGAVLGIDAPISAVNSGDRRVLVVCNKQTILLPVTPTTTPLDLIKSASNCLTEPIDVRTAVILESFQKVGLKRPLRNYEHVRDVMNSWDDDKQNDLMIVDSRTDQIDQDQLLSSQVADSKPEGMGCYIHYSSKPGKWSKRYFTLEKDGQLLMSKSETSKDKENICHLSDFDIYTPTERKIAKVKPPKKMCCFAVKSQQKSNIYVDESRFVHFFCTNDRNTATLFYKSLHEWRSWYLKHVMGGGQKKKADLNGYGSRNVSGNSEKADFSHTRGSSVGSHYQLGTFTPLLDLDMFSKEPKEEVYKLGALPDDAPLARLNSKAMHQRKMSVRNRGPPPLSYSLGTVTSDPVPQSSNSQNSLNNSQDSEPETFSPGGLLGHTYSTRQRAMQNAETGSKTSGSGPFTEGPNLMNSTNWNAVPSNNESGLNRRSSVRSNHHRRTSSDMQRSQSTRQKPKPLVDLTPQYREPPQHRNKGKGFAAETGSGPLIENATSIEEAIKVPSSTDWRARPSTGRPNHGTYGTGGHERTRSLKGRGEGLAAYTVNNHSGAPDDSNNAFTGGGLLAQAGFSQGHTPVGHGVMDGSKARGPMLDFSGEAKFAQGSLLASVERKHPSGPMIDRDRRQSVDLG